MAEQKTILVCSGGDWADADFQFWQVPAGLDIEQAERDWAGGRPVGWRSHKDGNFLSWLIKHHGAQQGGDIEEVWLD